MRTGMRAGGAVGAAAATGDAADPEPACGGALAGAQARSRSATAMVATAKLPPALEQGRTTTASRSPGALSHGRATQIAGGVRRGLEMLARPWRGGHGAAPLPRIAG